MKTTRVSIAVLVCVFGALVPLHATGSEGDVGQYIVTLEKSVKNVTTEANELKAEADTGPVLDTYPAVKGFLVSATAPEAADLASQPEVKAVELDGIAHALATQTGAPWGLDRIDQRTLPLSGSYSDPSNGSGVTAYIIDSGIRATHNDFGGRVSAGTNTISNESSLVDCTAHGTHVAGTVGGATYGVAKGVSLTAVRVFACENTTPWSEVIEGIDWVITNHTSGPAVANISIGGGGNEAVDNAVRALAADGVVPVVAAGNENADACVSLSPARVTEALTVGATDINDQRATFTNFGPCVDVHAPGVDVTSTSNTSDTGTNTFSGTSMSTPHVAGAVAQWLQTNPGQPVREAHNAIIRGATPSVIGGYATSCNVLDRLLGFCMPTTPNRVLFTPAAACCGEPEPWPEIECDLISGLLGLC